MAAGYLLKEANYIDRPLSDDETWSAFAYLFFSKSVNDTSYKFGFLKSILEVIMIVAVVFFLIALIGMITEHGVLALVCYHISLFIFCPTFYIWIRRKVGI
jgi:hypothetical protein